MDPKSHWEKALPNEAARPGRTEGIARTWTYRFGSLRKPPQIATRKSSLTSEAASRRQSTTYWPAGIATFPF